jgi:hypothetical protein
MRYKEFIEEFFSIDNAKTGQLIPFKFNNVQKKYYEELVKAGIEEGTNQPIREIILKARREGFTSLILALFATDDILTKNPTETMVVSYKIDSTKTFIKRYKNFILSYYKKRWNITDENKIFKTDASGEVVLLENGARFYCGTASARIGGRGGTLQKLLFSEAAWYPDKQELKASEIIEGTARQVDINAGHIFIESTANGDFNYYAKIWKESEAKQSRYIPRFYGWREFYSEQEFEIIKSEMTDKRLVKQEFPETAEEAFLASGDRFFDPTISNNLRTETPQVVGSWNYYGDFKPGHRYILGADVSEGVGRHNSTIVVIDMDYNFVVNGIQIQKPKVVAVYSNNKIAPDLFAYEIKNGGLRYGSCMAAPERNNHGFATLSILKEIYFNIYKDENEKLGWHTNLASKPKMLHDLRTAIHEGLIEIADQALKQEIISMPSGDLNVVRIDEDDETMGHYDRCIALSIAWALRSLATGGYVGELKDEEQTKQFDRYLSINEL